MFKKPVQEICGPLSLQTQFVVEPEPSYTRVCKRVSWEAVKLGIAVYAVAVALNGTYVAWGKLRALMEARTAKAVNESLELAGITFAPNWKPAPPMESKPLPRAALDNLIQSSADTYNMDPDLVWAIIQVESSGNPAAISEADARGLMQLNPKTRRTIGYTESDAHNALLGIEGGTYWLRKKLDEQRGDEDEAVQSYFCGPSCVGSRSGLSYLRKVRRAQGVHVARNG